ncbi:MAG TPA: hypothetical protein VMU64_06070 [Acidimicrobiales bacterium]|nr:hypothetical protein [Acidimicrobiales bacterium]
MFYALLGTLLIVLVMAGAALSLFFRRGGDSGRSIPEHPDAQGASR